MIGRDDGCHDVAAECGTSLKQTVGFGVNIKSGAVCGKTGVEPCGKARTDIAADICCTDKQNSGLAIVDDINDNLCVCLSVVVLEQLTFAEDNAIRTVCAEFIAKVGNIAAEEDCGKFGVELVRKLSAFAEKLKNRVHENAVTLFGKYPNALVIID